MPDELITLKRAAELFDVSVDRLRRAAHENRLITDRRGHERLVRPSEVQRFLREGGRAPAVVAAAAPAATTRQARIVAVAIVKGGTGKTTTTLNLGAALAEQGKRVLLVDLDPQCSLSLALGVNVQDIDATVHSAMVDFLATFEPHLERAILTTDIGVDLTPSSIRLGRLDKELNFATQKEFVLRKLLQPLAALYDFILIDTMPATNNLLTNALAAAHDVLIPHEPQYLSVESLAMTLEDVDQVRRSGLNPTLSVFGIVITKAKPQTTLHREVIDFTIEAYSRRARVLDLVIRDSIKFGESQTRHLSILQYQPNSDGAQAYRALAKELMDGQR
jgi:chromosome partitioning protein